MAAAWATALRAEGIAPASCVRGGLDVVGGRGGADQPGHAGPLLSGGPKVATRAVELLAELGVPACFVMGGLEVAVRAVEPLTRLGALAYVGDVDGCEVDEVVQNEEDQVDWERDAQGGGSPPVLGSAVPGSTGGAGPVPTRPQERG